MHTPLGEALCAALGQPFCATLGQPFCAALGQPLFTASGLSLLAPGSHSCFAAFGEALRTPLGEALFAALGQAFCATVGQASLVTLGDTGLSTVGETFRTAGGASFVHALEPADRKTLRAGALFGCGDFPCQAGRRLLVRRGPRIDHRARDGGFALGVQLGLGLGDGIRQLTGKLILQPVGERIDGLAQMVLNGHA